MPTRISPLAPFKHDIFRTIWIASLASNFGGLIQTVGAAWLMTSISSSANMVALVQASTSLPIMMFSLVSGALADNFDRRRIMLVAQCFMLTVSVLLTVCAYLGIITPWLLLLFTFLIGCGTALNNPSWQASVGDMVPRDDLPAAVALNSMGFNITRSVGPAIGGVIVATAGAAAAFAANSLSYFAILFALVRWRREVTMSPLPRETLGRAITAGLRYVVMSPNIGKVLVRGFLFGLSASAILALLPLVARDLVQGGPLTYGLMLGAFGLGAIGGALLSARLREMMSSEAIVRLAFGGFALSTLVIAFSPYAWLSCLMLLVSGASWVLALSLFNTTVQLSAPRWVVGRALSLYQTMTFGGIAGGSWLWGTTADLYGATNALTVSCLLMLAGAAVGLRLPLPEFKSLNLDPLNRFNEPPLELDLKPRSGPIVIMIDYEIDDADIPEFLETMAERRRIRIRDGAGHWALMRDLEIPTTWTETYHVPTWVEYVRHNQRRTQADASVGDKLTALHRGAAPPRVHRMIERQTIVPTHYERYKRQVNVDMH
ncbi:MULTISPECIES: MFS transporter [unclassified Ensifer]|uniref:MFS transporter n=1 Tax=unclassified Ensifer TaxID=2633371 RepID=UPI000812F72B|nr:MULTISPECIES: MFS transporter [unclassified Ensifer]OCP20850.1 ABC transporter permease [Ensifer sp. LC54]OCP24351.1 ABC transporter permease [Ensifer sp. LC384]OCP34547.1 ABC transporter permease [Ensifer sp. LC163]